MPTFAELRAKAEAAANAARDSANHRIADYRGDKKPEKPVYRAPARRPTFKPDLPDASSRPKPAGYDVEEVPHEEEVQNVVIEQKKPATRAQLGTKVVQNIEESGKGIDVLLQNKELFFQFMDEFFAAKGFDVQPRVTPNQIHEEPLQIEEREERAEREEQKERDRNRSEEILKQESAASTPTEVSYHHEAEEYLRPQSPVSPPPEPEPAPVPVPLPVPVVTPKPVLAPKPVPAPKPPIVPKPPISPKPASMTSPSRKPKAVPRAEPPSNERVEATPPSTPPPVPPPASIRKQKNTPRTRIDQPSHEQVAATPPSSPPPMLAPAPSRKSKALPRVERTSDEQTETASSPPTSPRARRMPPPQAHRPPPEPRPESPPPSGRGSPPPIVSPRPSAAVFAVFGNLQGRHAGGSTTSFATTSASTTRGHTHNTAPTPSAPSTPTSLRSFSPVQDEKSQPSSKPSNLSKLLQKLPSPKRASSRRSTRSSSSSGDAPPPVPLSTRPPAVNRAARPTPSSVPIPLSGAHVGAIGIGPPPSMFFTGETSEDWLPPSPYGYMPSAGRDVTEGQCSAAQLCSYFAASVPWDSWYMADDSSARPASIVDRVEARWKGSVLHSQETKKRLFGSGKTKNERTRTAVVTFQDLSIAWYRVTWREEDPFNTLKREARYRAAPSPWDGDRLYAAHTLYGQAITDFCERAIRMKQLVGGGEAWDLTNGAVTSVARYKPNARPIIPPVGHCYGHLIYEGYLDGQRMWGSTRGGETAIRNGDVIQWCDAQVQLLDENEETTVFSFGATGYTSIILSGAEFPELLSEDFQTLPPTRLPDVTIVMQSAASAMLPTRKLVLFNTLQRGRIWIYRPVGWDYVGLNAEPEADWPPPDPTLFLPS